ncbi:MAG: beta-ketoacyl-ACP synthase III [candidate division WOR-3 bacterium]|nr:ketoacyl-ACP synthase III [candidate division WOR-3 bacterium]MDH7518741.1 beta-ketoacyl-ACP synthase III [bacterium]
MNYTLTSPRTSPGDAECQSKLCSAIFTGTGFAVPERILTNNDLEKILETSDEWIVERTGMKERRIAKPEEAASDFALRASQQALADARIKPEEIDLIIVATVTGDMPFPSTACILQHKLGATNAAAMDLAAGCSGFIYALTTARQFIATGTYRTVLVVGVEVLSKITDWTDRSTAVLLADGAGAAILQASTEKERGIIATYLGADGSHGKDLYMPAGGSAIPASLESIQQRLHYLKMNGSAIFKIAVRSMADVVRRLLDKTKLPAEEIKLIIPHQANLRIIEAMAKLINFPMEKVFVNIQKYANTSSASTIIALDEARKQGLIHPGDKVILVAFGAGLTWGGTLVCF